jgi:hypothetical protein
MDLLGEADIGLADLRGRRTLGQAKDPARFFYQQG